MLNRFALLRQPIEDLLAVATRYRRQKTYEKLSCVVFHDKEWELISDTAKILEMFEKATRLCTSENVLTIYKAYQIFEGLLTFMDGALEAFKKSPNDAKNLLKSQEACEALDAAQTKLQEYYDLVALDEAMLVPILLDPRYGMQHVENIWKPNAEWIDGAECVLVLVRL